MTIKLKATYLMPAFMTTGSVGADVLSSDDVNIASGEVAYLKTGLYIVEHNDIELGSLVWKPELQFRARSSLAKLGLIIPHGLGTIDGDYRDEILLPLRNINQDDLGLFKNTRLGQLVINYVPTGQLQGDVRHENTKRQGGFGSTGN